MNARCTSCGREARFRRFRGFRLDLQRCECGGSYARVVAEPVERRPCRGDAMLRVPGKSTSLSCWHCERYAGRFDEAKCLGDLGLALAEEEVRLLGWRP